MLVGAASYKRYRERTESEIRQQAAGLNDSTSDIFSDAAVTQARNVTSNEPIPTAIEV